MKLVNVQDRNKKELAAIQKKVTAFVKKCDCNTGDIRFNSNGNVQYIEVENDGKLGPELADFVKSSPTGQVVNVFEYTWDYDWQADTYIRPVSIVTFKF